MCDPISIGVASLAIGTASAGMGFMQQSSQAKMQRKAVQEDYTQQMQALNLQYDQTNKQAIDEMSARAREAMIESARLRAFSGESGLAGISNERIKNESAFNLGTDISSIESNRQASLRQLHQEGKGVRAQTTSKINEVVKNRPSLIGTGLQIAGVAANTASNYQAAKAKLPAHVRG
ncbi:hypothetical protein SAMN05216412_11031 [Nitrosospira multiformis]|uniref:Uncharacterized protein n=1 Tax=Nitrosospira multiformis TaxID=1231 RepID=A0A1I0FUQ0_9PROT|nr:hypothetical protein [Nitrosospira multiformis]SET61179.1 hypothetical protein SAMN05216412_11031 [Nitrosospira multiformis]